MTTPQDENSPDRTAHATVDVKTVAVLGAGTMGHGIAQTAAAAGYRVVLRDVTEELLSKARRSIESNLSKGVEKGKVTPEEKERALSNLSTTVLLEETAGAELFIEAVPERLELKRETLAESNA